MLLQQRHEFVRLRSLRKVQTQIAGALLQMRVLGDAAQTLDTRFCCHLAQHRRVALAAYTVEDDACELQAWAEQQEAL